MSEKYAKAGKGLKIIFWSEIWALIGVVVSLIPLLGWVVGFILILASGIGSIYGLVVARNSHPSYMNALYMVVIGTALSLLGDFFSEGILGGILSIGSALTSFAQIYFICTATADLLSEKGFADQAAKGAVIWKLNAIVCVVSILNALLGWMTLVGAILVVAGWVTAILGIVAGILLLIFYHKSAPCLLD